MNQAQIEKNIQELVKLEKIVQASKFATLHRLKKTKRNADIAFDMSIMAKNIFHNMQTNYRISALLDHQAKSMVQKTLWIFLTQDHSLLFSSFAEQETKLVKNFKPNHDLLVTIGSAAQTFAQKNKIKSLLHVSNKLVNHDRISSLIYSLFVAKKVTQVKFIFPTNRAHGTITILPISQLNIHSKNNQLLQINYPLVFYPSISDILESLMTFYVTRLTHALFVDANYFFLYQRLVKYEKSLDLIKHQIQRQKHKLNKLLRKIYTDEIIAISRYKERVFNE